MGELVNIYSDDIRGKVRKSPAWIKDAWVEFFDDVRAGRRNKEEGNEKEIRGKSLPSNLRWGK